MSVFILSVVAMTRRMVVPMSSRMVHAMTGIAVAGMTPAMMMMVIIAGAQAHKAGNGDECDDEFLVHGVLLCLRYYKIATG